MIQRRTACLCLLLLLCNCRDPQPAMARQERLHPAGLADLDAYQRGLVREIAIARDQLRELSDSTVRGAGFGGKGPGLRGSTDEGARAAGLPVTAYRGLVSKLDSLLVAHDTLTWSPAFAGRALLLDSLRTELIVLRSRLNAEASAITTDNP